MSLFATFTNDASINILASVFVFAIGLVVLALVVMFFIDVTQTADAVRRNYPVVGRFRHIFTTLGEYFRQYFFAMDREEMPFNRAERDWVYKSRAVLTIQARSARQGPSRRQARQSLSIAHSQKLTKTPSLHRQW